MCGLFAQWSAQAVDPDPVMAVLRSRGPDDQGQWAQPVAGGILQLLHTRLAIQDLSPAGHQPMQSPDQHFTLVFNGEIYNAPALRGQLEAEGIRFRSQSDTEVLLAGFARWGVELFTRLNGIFALAIWDARLQQLTVARDRFGVKPLLWWCGPEGWALASELSVLRAAGIPSRPRLDQVALEQFWQWGSVQSPRTFIQGVESLPPGCWAQWQAEQSCDRWTCERYVDWPATVLTAGEISYEEAVDHVSNALQAAVSRQMLSDVSVGAFLSGGLDSASIVALMAAGTEQPVRTFSLGFAKNDCSVEVVDERGLAAVVARHFSTDHHEIILSSDDFISGLLDFTDAIDQPSVDGLNTFMVARQARRHGLSVAMSGLGGDEIFAGYPVFQQAWRFQRKRKKRLHAAARLPWRLLQRLGWERARFALGSEDALSAYRRLHSGCERMGSSILPGEENLDPVSQVSCLELRGYLLNTLLRDADAVTMHHALELRVPFLDHELVNLLLSLPSAYKFKKGMSKPLLVDAMGMRLPREILHAPKRGFELPIAQWLQELSAPSLTPDVLGPIWCERVGRAHRLYGCKPARYRGWWQWHLLSRWLSAWPDLKLAD
jgi:asparagine synthase (glutamine-hydrolysing)